MDKPTFSIKIPHHPDTVQIKHFGGDMIELCVLQQRSWPTIFAYKVHNEHMTLKELKRITFLCCKTYVYLQ